MVLFLPSPFTVRRFRQQKGQCLMAATHLALLRGINVGGKNMLPMQDLIALFSQAGCRGVRTYIQSGNVLFGADPDLAAALPALIASRIAERFGYRVPVVLRTAAQLAEVVRANPFLEAGAAEDALHVLFLADQPSETAIAELDPDRSPPDAFAVRGREVYLHLPNGMGRTRLTSAYFDAKLSTVGTARNWRTVTTLLGMMTR
jgi:uncharacterized protein (DUF1697 family)